MSEGLLGVAAECPPENRESVVAAIWEEITQYQKQDFSEALARAKRQTMVSQFRTLTSASGRATDLASNWHEARDLHYTSRFLEALEKVTTDDIRRCCASLVERNMTVTLLNPEEMTIEESLNIASSPSSEVQTVLLSNGLEVAMFPNQRLPLISIQTAIRGGLSTVIPDQAGIVPLLAATLDEGTDTRNGWDIASTLEGLGASLSASAGNNTMIVSASGLAEDRETLIEILADVMLQPSFPEDSLKRNQQSQLNSLLESLEDPLSIALQHLRELLFGPQTYGLPSQGNVESLPKLGRADLLAYHQTHFTARNSKMAIAGDFDPEDMIALLEKHLSAMTPGSAISLPSTQLQQNRTKEVSRNKKQAVLAIGYPGISATDDRRFASMMLMEYCSDMAGPLFTRIREELGLAYQVGAFGFHGHDTGMMAFYLSTSAEQLDLAHQELQQQIQKIAEQGIPEQVFENVRATVLSAMVMRQQSLGSTARQAAVDLLFGQPATHHREMHRKIEALHPQEVRELAHSLLRNDHAVVSIVRPEEPPQILD
jgi:zinc protease